MWVIPLPLLVIPILCIFPHFGTLRDLASLMETEVAGIHKYWKFNWNKSEVLISYLIFLVDYVKNNRLQPIVLKTNYTFLGGGFTIAIGKYLYCAFTIELKNAGSSEFYSFIAMLREYNLPCKAFLVVAILIYTYTKFQNWGVKKVAKHHEEIFT